MKLRLNSIYYKKLKRCCKRWDEKARTSMSITEAIVHLKRLWKSEIVKFMDIPFGNWEGINYFWAAKKEERGPSSFFTYGVAPLFCLPLMRTLYAQMAWDIKDRWAHFDIQISWFFDFLWLWKKTDLTSYKYGGCNSFSVN